MHFRFVTYRWGEELLGGAEIHHRRLARELVDLGHRVTVLTTTGMEIRPFCHWGVLWSREVEAGESDDDGIAVHRYPLRTWPVWAMALGAKALQFRMEREEARVPRELLTRLAGEVADSPAMHLLSGWHFPDIQDGRVSRWTHGRALVYIGGALPEKCVLRLSGYAPKANRLRMESNGRVLSRSSVAEGSFSADLRLYGAKPGIFEITLSRVWRPLREFRGLGVNLHAMELVDESDGRVAARADLTADFRTLGRRLPEAWFDALARRAMERPGWSGWVFDRLRGPNSPAMRRAVVAGEADVTIHCNLPWANVGWTRPGDLVMPLWHLEDDFYYWRHYIQAMRRSRFVLANTPFSEREFYPRLGIRAHYVGPPIWPEPEKANDVYTWRDRHGIGRGDVLVLVVSRKSPEKRYEAVAESVTRLRDEGLPVRMIGIGPDADRRAFDYDGCQWIGRQDNPGLQTAYAACDVFCHMSESESFGMVIPEAWHHGRPVVVNRLCGPSSSLVSEGEDGLLAAPGGELDAALRRLVESPEMRRRLGEAGRAKAQRDFVRGAAARRLIEALENAPI